MNFFGWLADISKSAAPAGESWSPGWLYVVMALVIPVGLGAILAGIIRMLEKTFRIRLGGGSV